MLIIKNCRLMDMKGIDGDIMDIYIGSDGKIRAIEKELDPAQYPNIKIVDAKERLVTPGLVEPHCHMGIYETGVRVGMDGNEMTKPSTPALRAIDAIDPRDSAYDVAIRQGVTTVVTGPGSGNVIGGIFTAMKTSGNILDRTLVCEEVAMKMALGENPKISYANKGQAPSTRMMSAAIMREELFKARHYREKYMEYEEQKKSGRQEGFEFDLNMHNLMKVFDGLRVKIHAHQADDILTAIRISEEFGLNYSIDHCTEGYMIADELKAHKTQCIIGPIVGGKSKFESRNKSLDSARILEEKGVDFAIMTDHPVIPIEGILMQLALLVKHGLSRENALKGVTINAARVNDIDDRVGSIEVGKDGDIVIWDVDPLDTMSETGFVIIDGKVVYEKKRGEVFVDYKKL